MYRMELWLALLLLTAVGSRAKGQVTLTWKFHEGETYYVETITDQRQSLVLKGQTIKQDMSKTTVTSFTVKKKTPRETVVAIKIEDVKVKADTPADARIAEKMKGASFTVTLDATNKTTKLEGYDEFVKHLADGKDDVEKVIRNAMKEEDIKKGFEESFVFLPPRPVSVGGTWKKDSQMPLGPFGSFKMQYTYTYKGKENKSELIVSEASVTYSPPSGDSALLKVTKGKLEADEAKGSFHFDAEAGRLIRGDSRLRMHGTLGVDIGGEQQEMQISADWRTSIRVLDRKP
jgi:uncharacterized protein DUF6263